MHQLLPPPCRAKALPNLPRWSAPSPAKRPSPTPVGGCIGVGVRVKLPFPDVEMDMEKSGVRGGECCVAPRRSSSSASAAITRRQNGPRWWKEECYSHGKLGRRVADRPSDMPLLLLRWIVCGASYIRGWG